MALVFAAVTDDTSGIGASSSNNGATWLQQSIPSGYVFGDLAWNGSVFAAVTSDASGIAATSPDGITWTQQSMPAGFFLAVAWNGSVFAAVTDDGSGMAATSPDGVTWTQRAMPAHQFSSIAWNGSVFAAVTEEFSGVAATSPDGITWTQRSIPAHLYTGIAWNGSVFVAVTGDASGGAATSPDGITWTARSMPASYFSDVAWNGSVFAAVTSTASGISATSPDGITWTQHSMPAYEYSGIAWNGDVFAAVSNDNSGVAAISADGATWTQESMPNAYFSAVAAGAIQYDFSIVGAAHVTFVGPPSSFAIDGVATVSFYGPLPANSVAVAKLNSYAVLGSPAKIQVPKLNSYAVIGSKSQAQAAKLNSYLVIDQFESIFSIDGAAHVSFVGLGADVSTFNVKGVASVTFYTPQDEFIPSPCPIPSIGALPVTLQNIIASYLYQQYSDDDNLQAFVAAYNQLAQAYLAWFNQENLPVYTGLSGSLLDWVAQGLYGISRPSLPSGVNKSIGPYNTYAFNQIAFNAGRVISTAGYYATSDDTFKRIITWHFYKGDGKQFSVTWLKRRIMRFLYGYNGYICNIDETFPISVSFAPGNMICISFPRGVRTFASGATYNSFALNSRAFNTWSSTYSPIFANSPEAVIFQTCVEANAIELPFQYIFAVTVNGITKYNVVLLTDGAGNIMTDGDGNPMRAS